MKVGLPNWSSTTRTGPPRSASESIVVTKLRPCAPQTQAVRTTWCSGSVVRTSSSPAALLRPYTERGSTPSNSVHPRGVPSARVGASPPKT